MNISTIFIDLDDTLWDFTSNSKLSLRHVYDYYNLKDYSDNYEDFKRIYVEKNIELWELYHHGKIEKDFLVTERFRHTLEMIGYKKEDIVEFAQQIDNEYLHFLSLQNVLVDGARELLDYLSNKYEIGILSNGFKGVQAQKLRSAGIDHYIDLIVLSDDIGITKPMKGIFDYALSQKDAEAESTIMIGDNYDADILGAKNAGWKTIYFNRKGNLVDNNKADYTVKHLTEIIDIL